MKIKNPNKPQNAKFSILSFDTGLSSELTFKTTTFSRKNENWHDRIFREPLKNSFKTGNPKNPKIFCKLNQHFKGQY